MNIRSMLASHPNRSEGDIEVLAPSIEALLKCATTCTTCADACLSEEKVDTLRTCIQLNLNCADICSTTGHLLCRTNAASDSLLHTQLEACRDICAACAEECERHADMHEHCRLCAEACRACEEQCSSLLSSLARSVEA